MCMTELPQIQQSGAAVPLNVIDDDSVQNEYDDLVNAVGCNTAEDTLQCLRGVPYSTLRTFLLASPGIFSYTSLGLVRSDTTDELPVN